MIVAPSVLSIDFTNLKSNIEALNNSNAKWVHFDVMDGHFVPNLTFGPDILKAFKKMSDLVMDVHIMVSNPYMFAPIFIDAGADILTFHYEALNDCEIDELINLIHQKGAKAGISIKPQTDVEVLLPYLDKIDLVLIMSVEPGFGGQKFDDSSLNKIKFLSDIKYQNNYHYLIEVDGGINDETVKLVKEAGVEVVVAGSYVFKGDIMQKVDSLL